MHCFRPIDTVLPPLPLQATRVKVNSLPPPVLAAALASLAALHQAAGQRGRRRRQAAQDPMPPVDPQGDQKQQQLGLVHEEREGEDRQPLLPLWSNQPAAAGTQLLSHSALEPSLPQLLMPATPQGYEARVRSAAKTI